MAGRPQWTHDKVVKGVKNYELLSWKYYLNFINKEMLDYTGYVYRGHACRKWKLEPTIDRIINDPNSRKREEHLEKFKFETRGRRGSNPPLIDDDNDWWALGQHHGLATPLLDWTESPFVALFFAADTALRYQSEYITINALAIEGINERNDIVNANDKVVEINGHKPTVKIVRPLSDENNRLVSQRGLFTRGPNNMDIETWIVKFETPKNDEEYDLIKIHIPNKNMESCLRYLNRMNINHSTIFPDLTGASDFCNKHLSISEY